MTAGPGPGWLLPSIYVRFEKIVAIQQPLSQSKPPPRVYPGQIQLLRTKLYMPLARPGLVARDRLTGLVDQGVQHKLTLISAPAGFGKTTVLSAWRAASPQLVPTANWPL